MLYSSLIGATLDAAKDYVERNNIKAVFVETKDRYNDYEVKRIIRVKHIDDGQSLEIIYSGFPNLKD